MLEQAEGDPAEAATGDETAEPIPGEAGTSLAAIAKEFGLEEADFLGRVMVPAADGKSVPLAEAIEAFRKAPEVPRLHAELAERSAALESERASLSSTYQESAQRLDGFLSAAAGLLQHEEQAVNWAQLEAEDPANYLAQRRHFDSKVATFRGFYQQLQSERAQLEAKNNEARARYRADQQKIFLAQFPELRAAEKAKPWFDEVRETLREVGFKDDELDPEKMPIFDDARVWRLLRMAADHRRVVKEAPLVMKRVRELPKPSVHSAARKDQLSAKAQAAKRGADLMKRLNGSGDVKDAAALLMEVL